MNKSEMNPPSPEEESTLGEHLSDLGVGKFARTVALATAIGAVGVEVGLETSPTFRYLANTTKNAIENVHDDIDSATKTELYEHNQGLSEDELALKSELTEELGRAPNYDEFHHAHYYSSHNHGAELRVFVREMKLNGPMSGYSIHQFVENTQVHLQNEKLRTDPEYAAQAAEGMLKVEAKINARKEKEREQNRIAQSELVVTLPKDVNSPEGKEELRQQVGDLMDAYHAQREGL